jgi:hypothetical protein
MLVAVLAFLYIFLLRHLYQKKLKEERERAGIPEATGPAGYADIKKNIEELTRRLASMEAEYRELAERLGGVR